MARKIGTLEVNTFIGGLNTDASPLNYPQDASADEKNFVLNKNGLRTRRLGFDLEDAYVKVTTEAQVGNGRDLVVNFHKWNNVGGDSTKTIIVVQVNEQILFFDGAADPLSSGFIDSYSYTVSGGIPRISFADVDGSLIAVNGAKTFNVFVYADGEITRIEKYLKIRDLFGVEDNAA
jgi:hypothetical protein